MDQARDTPRLLAVCAVHQLRADPGAVGTTAIDKRPLDGPVKVGRFGIYGDVQADRKNHGGDEKAVYVYAQDDADWWAAELGREVPYGTLFGENLRTEGLDVSGARIGERWRIGGVEIEATMPRSPCMTFARHMGLEQEGWVKRFADARRLGTYFRVVRKGALSAGDGIERVHVPADAPTASEIFR